MSFKTIVFAILIICNCGNSFDQSPRPVSYVVGGLEGQLGNNMFIVASISAFAWDHGAIPTFPELVQRHNEPFNPKNAPLVYEHVLFRCNTFWPNVPMTFHWREPIHCYHEIPYHPNMYTNGYYQSEKYFKHHRDKILKLFAPRSDDWNYLSEKYRWLIDHPYTVGVQIRKYYEDPNYPFYQYGTDYIQKASQYFGPDAMYIVTSNDIEFAKSVFPKELQNVYFVENEPHYIDLHLLTLCKHNIITNSTFGWWAAWLNQNPLKIVIAPRVYFFPEDHLPIQDLYPPEWILIDSKKAPLNDPENYQ